MTTIRKQSRAGFKDSWRDYKLLLGIALVILLLDQTSKAVIVHLSGFELGLYPPFGGKVIIPGLFNLAYAVNYGAAWGILHGFSWLLVVFAVVVMVMMVLFRRELALRMVSSQWCFGLISGGIIGNTIDRLLRGHVVDFLDVRLPGYQWPTFNVADSAIVVGTLLYIVLQLRTSSQ